jgi:hypothetical protein
MNFGRLWKNWVLGMAGKWLLLSDVHGSGSQRVAVPNDKAEDEAEHC